LPAGGHLWGQSPWVRGSGSLSYASFVGSLLIEKRHGKDREVRQRENGAIFIALL
jgi:hypothetical protein